MGGHFQNGAPYLGTIGKNKSGIKSWNIEMHTIVLE
jgi:hypothetical protein